MSTSPTLIRTLSHNSSELAILEKRCFEGSAWSVEQLESELSRFGHLGFLLYQDAKVLGYVLGWVIEDECELLRIAVNPRDRGQGHAHLLITQFLTAAEVHGSRQCFLEVRNSNTAAIALYEHHGFQRTGIRHGYYADRTDALLMTAALPSIMECKTD